MFDPYHKWLGISKKHRPPTYYRLLGIDEGEDDPEVIEEAALRQQSHLRIYQMGQHSALATKLLNEVAQARSILLNPAKRKAYERSLAHKNGQPPSATPVTVPKTGILVSGKSVPSPNLPVARPAEPLPIVHPAEKKRNLAIHFGLAGGIGGLLLVAGVVAILISGGGEPPNDKSLPNDSKKAETTRPKLQKQPAKPQTEPKLPPKQPVEKAEPPIDPAWIPRRIAFAGGPLAPAAAWELHSGGFVAVAANGRLFARAQSDGIELFDAEKRAFVGQIPADRFFTPSGVVVSAKGKYVAGRHHLRSVQIWDCASNRMVLRLTPDIPSLVASFRFLPDETLLVTSSYRRYIKPVKYSKCLVQVWHIRRGRVVKQLELQDDNIPEVFFASDDRVLFRVSQRGFRLWRWRTGELGPVHPGHAIAYILKIDAVVRRTRQAGDGKRVLEFVDPDSGRVLRKLAKVGSPSWIQFTADGKYAVCGCLKEEKPAGGVMRVWDLESETKCWEIGLGNLPHMYNAALSSNGSCLVLSSLSDGPGALTRFWVGQTETLFGDKR